MPDKRSYLFLTTLFVIIFGYFGTRLGHQAHEAWMRLFYDLDISDFAGLYLMALCVAFVIALLIGIFSVIFGLAAEYAASAEHDDDPGTLAVRITAPVIAIFGLGFCYSMLIGPYGRDWSEIFWNGWGILLVLGLTPVIVRLVNFEWSKPKRNTDH